MTRLYKEKTKCWDTINWVLTFHVLIWAIIPHVNDTLFPWALWYRKCPTSFAYGHVLTKFIVHVIVIDREAGESLQLCATTRSTCLITHCCHWPWAHFECCWTWSLQLIPGQEDLSTVEYSECALKTWVGLSLSIWANLPIKVSLCISVTTPRLA